MQSHVHTPGDGRGRRRVLLNGEPISRVVFADTSKGVVRVIPFPVRMHKHGKRAIYRTLRGKVELEPIHDKPD